MHLSLGVGVECRWVLREGFHSVLLQLSVAGLSGSTATMWKVYYQWISWVDTFMSSQTFHKNFDICGKSRGKHYDKETPLLQESGN